MQFDLNSVASNGYTKYWLTMITSLIENIRETELIYVHILTDDVPLLKIQAPQSPHIQYIFHNIPSEPWPLPTLNRYEYIKNILPEFRTSHFMYIDADMIFHEGFEADFLVQMNKNRINFVQHPGFWYPKLSTFIKMKPKKILSNIKCFILLGGLGAWENRKSSTAFVPRSKRKKYICGGIWFGQTTTLTAIVDSLQLQTEQDYSRGIIAKWHDESHLNKWFVLHGGALQDPSYCFEPSFTNLSGLKPKIEAVDKSKF